LNSYPPKNLSNQGIRLGLFPQLHFKLSLELSEQSLEIEIAFFARQAYIAERCGYEVEFAHSFDGSGVTESLHILVVTVRVAPVAIGAAKMANSLAVHRPCLAYRSRQ
jgi:hypothetical protein